MEEMEEYLQIYSTVTDWGDTGERFHQSSSYETWRLVVQPDASGSSAPQQS